jgi:hypothetical protein
MGFQNGKIVRVTVEAIHSDGDSQVNVFHYDLVNSSDGTDPQNDPQALADFFRDNVIQHVRPLYDDTWLIQPVVVADERDPLNPDLPRQEWVSGSAVAGTRINTTDLLPRACTVCVKIWTDHIGKRATGRKFIGGSWSESSQANGAWDNLVLTDCFNYLNAVPKAPDIALGPSGAHAFWCVYSRTARSQNVGSYSFGVTGFTARTAVHWLRSRATV